MHRDRGERGASLVLALAFVTVVGLAGGAILEFGNANVRAATAHRDLRSVDAAADGALEAAIDRVASTPLAGIDPGLAGAATCRSDVPATSSAPAMVVHCGAQTGSRSGAALSTGLAPQYSILTLGQRNTEPVPYNDRLTGEVLGVLDAPAEAEVGVKAMAATPGPVQGMNVEGDAFSNSPVEVAAGASITVQSGGHLVARGGCTGTVNTCTAYAFAQNPSEGLDDALLPTVTNPSGLVNRDASVPAGCPGAAPNVVTFLPGVYTDAQKLNDLFGAATCKDATFWLAPDLGADGLLGGGGADADDLGVYYFDFEAGTASDPSYACGAMLLDLLYDASKHRDEWCIGGKASDYHPHVVGGWPYGWDPFTPASTLVTLEPATSVGLLTPFGGVADAAYPANNALAVDGVSTRLSIGAVGGLLNGGRLVLGGFPAVPDGPLSGPVDVKVTHRVSDPTALEGGAPSIRVRYGGLFKKTCGPYRLQAASVPSAALGEQGLSAAQQGLLSACLGTGDRVSSLDVVYEARRASGSGASTTVLVDGARVEVSQPWQARFPVVPSGSDPGGDCDPRRPGVQMIFGGDSRVYVANGSLEVCAGPSTTNPETKQQIAIYGVPADWTGQTSGGLRTIQSNVDVATNATCEMNAGMDSCTNIAKASVLAEPDGAPDVTNASTIAYHGACAVNVTCILGSGSATVEGRVLLDFPAYTPPAGYSVSKVTLRASYKTASLLLGPQFQVFRTGGSAFDCGRSSAFLASVLQVPLSTSIVGASTDVTSCLTTARLASAFQVHWVARKVSTCVLTLCVDTGTLGADLLDGVQLVIELDPTTPTTAFRPAQGCVTAPPNFWNGFSDPDCAQVKVGQTEVVGTDWHGRLSAKGTVYLPSAAVDVDDTCHGDCVVDGVRYPFFGRGLVARHLRVKGFQYNASWSGPIADNTVDTSTADREVCFVVDPVGTSAPADPCDPSLSPDAYARARVRFEAGTGDADVVSWVVGRTGG